MASQARRRFVAAMILALLPVMAAGSAWDRERVPWSEHPVRAKPIPDWWKLARRHPPPPETVGTLAGLGANLIFVYQSFLSGRTGSRCQFYPSCSRYGRISIERFGLLPGVVMTADRLSRCHPRAHLEHPTLITPTPDGTLIWNDPYDDAWWH